MSFRKLVTSLVGAGLLALPVVAVSAAPAEAASPYQTRVSIQRGPALQLYGKNVQIQGLLEGFADDTLPGTWAPIDDGIQQVTLQRRFAGKPNFINVATDTVDDQGAYSFLTPAWANATYRVVYSGGFWEGNPAEAEFQPSTSANAGVKVARDLKAKKRKISPSKFRFYGKVAPKYAKKKVVLQRKLGNGRWRTIDSQLTNRKSQWGWTVSARSDRGKVRYRAFTAKNKQYAKSFSATFIITTF